MEKLFGYLKRNIKLAFKTVTFHFKEYLCFYIAILIIQTLFGIIIMSSSNSITTEKKEISSSYGYHIAFMNMNERQYTYFDRMLDPDYNPKDYKNEKVKPPQQTSITKALLLMDEDSRGRGDSKLYDMYFVFDDGNGSSLDTLYERYQKYYEKDINSLRTKDGTFEIVLSPLFDMSERIDDIKGSCALWLFILALVSILVLILLYNIRINHFKFTYGIYMSFGADSRTLFGTCFWEVMMISWLTLIPAAAISTVTDFVFASIENYDYYFSPYLMLFAILFMIPIVLISVYLPVKATAVKPPLKLLLAEDNSNLVTSPRISTQLLGKSFPSSYERLSFSRFKKYNAQLIFSSVIFAAIFVWTSFYCSIYEYNISSKQPEFTVNFEQKKIVNNETLIVKDKEVADFDIKRKAIYTPDAYMKRAVKDGAVSEFEKYYDQSRFTHEFDDESVPNVRLRRFYSLDGTEVTPDYEAALDKALDNGYAEDDLRKLEEYLTSKAYVVERNSETLIAEKVFNAKEEIKTTVTYDGPTYESDMGDELRSINGVVDLFKVCSTDAFGISSMMMFQASDVRGDSGFTVHPNASKYTDVTMDVQYRAADDEVIQYIENNFKYTGDLNDITLDRVIISDSVFNQSVLKIKPGDTIQIATLKSLKKQPTASDGLEGNKYLDFLLQYGEFEYRQYNVGAVIHDMASSDKMVVYLPDSQYELITGSKPLYKEVSVFVDQSMSNEAVRMLSSDLRAWADDYDYTKIEWLDSLNEMRAERTMRKLPIFQTIAVTVLILSPIFWFFAQIMFYKKREKEIELLRGMGAIEKEIRKIFLFDGAVIALLGALATVLLSVVGVYGMYRLAQGILTVSASGIGVKYYFEAPWAAGITAVIASAVFGFLSAYIPYIVNKRSSNKKLSEEFGG